MNDDVNPKTIAGSYRVDISLLPSAGIIHGAHSMMDGAKKYGPYNWREKKVPARTYVAAAMRHLMDYLDGENQAKDSNVHHLGHVIGCCSIVLDAMETGNLIDDRPVAGAASDVLERLATEIKEREGVLPPKEGWIEHDGGVMPDQLRHLDFVDVKFRDGSVAENTRVMQWTWEYVVTSQYDLDIVAYRRAKK